MVVGRAMAVSPQIKRGKKSPIKLLVTSPRITAHTPQAIIIRPMLAMVLLFLPSPRNIM